MNMEFPIFIIIKGHFKFYFDCFLLFLFQSQSWYFDRRFAIFHVIKEPFTTNISQQSLIFSLEVIRSWFFISLGFFELFLSSYRDKTNNGM